MYRRVAVLAVALLVATALPVLAVEKPTPTEGDRWTYSVPAEDAPRTSVAQVTVRNGTDYVVRSVTWSNQTTANPIPGQPAVTTSTQTATTRTYDAATGALKRVVTETAQSAGGISTGTNVQTTTVVYDPPCAVMAWPIQLDKTWSVECAFTTTTSTSTSAPGAEPAKGTLKADYAVKAREDVTVPAGTFTAYKIVNVTGGKDQDAQWFAPSACGVVKTADAAGKTTSELVTYACATPGEDDFVPPPPPPEQEPPQEEPPAPEQEPEAERQPDDGEPAPAPAPEPKKGLPAPGALAALAGLAAAARALRRRA